MIVWGVIKRTLVVVVVLLIVVWVVLIGVGALTETVVGFYFCKGGFYRFSGLESSARNGGGAGHSCK